MTGRLDLWLLRAVGRARVAGLVVARAALVAAAGRRAA